MADDTPQPIIIKRIAGGHGGHHGGSWKVAFADFATAMMAFFMLMWLMGATTAQQRGGISQYFKNPSVVQGASPLPSPNAMEGPGGASTSLIDLGGGASEMYQNPAPADSKESDDARKKAGESGETVEQKMEREQRDAQERAEVAADSERLESLMENLKIAIEQVPTLKPFKDQILLEITTEGLRIQVIDKESRSMFDIGSGSLKDYSLAVLMELAKAIAKVPNRVSISGHTDSKQYNRQQYGNWELSADRANSARRALIAGGVPEPKIGRVVGLSSTVPLDRENDGNPINRRISIVVMNKRTEEAIRQESGSLFSVQDQSSSSSESPTAAAVTPPPPAVPGLPAVGPR